DTLGPLVLVRLPAARVLLVRASCLSEVRAPRGWEPQGEGETRALLDRLHLVMPGPWAGIALERRDTAVVEPPRADPQKKWRALIRRRMERNRIPDFRRLVDRLAQFGVEETTSGKGSHGTLRLRGRQERKQTTWYALRRKADPLPIPFIWECLERLGIGYQDFYRSLSDD